MTIITKDEIEQEAIHILKEPGYLYLNYFTAECDQISNSTKNGLYKIESRTL